MGGEHPNEGRYAADMERVAGQVGVTDAATRMSNLLDGTFLGGAGIRASRTDFENHGLNEMKDLVAHTRPEDLESAGKVLLDARDAIKEAADMLKGHIGRVHWVGESGDAFRDWGDRLVKHAGLLADFADTAGIQIVAAATGLDSVIKSMPPRDGRADPVTVEDIPEDKWVDSNDEYTGAVRAEKHRQEAINQMNRLASFYAVSEEVLAAQEPPKFQTMPNVGVPKPAPGWVAPGSGEGDRGQVATFASTSGGHETTRHVLYSDVGSTGDHGDVTGPHETRHVDPLPDRHVSTEIDSVDTLQPPTANPPTGNPPITQHTSGPGQGPLLPPSNGVPNLPFTRTGGRVTGIPAGGTKMPTGPQGRPLANGSEVAKGTSRTPMGRGMMPGQAAGRGNSPKGQTPVQRGITGGTPRPGNRPGTRPGAGNPANPGRGASVIGGKPVAGKPASPKGKLPRGTVVGAEGTERPNTPPGGRNSQRGVIGVPEPETGPGGNGRAGRRSLANADGVVGALKGRTNRTGSRTNEQRRDVPPVAE
ncbi:hypothetical protein ACFV6E_26780 [Streptomyces sp. NPDC059785]|uniref:hypothetical protein n=1 Tax=Streptomyces sp. NPDC059785 TaxID=3346945 RepID=UPI0036570A9D